MNRTERFYKIDQMLHERRVVPLEAFLAELEISRATFKRDLEYLRERLNAPIVWDRQAGGYRFDTSAATGPICELPGVWFSAGELYACSPRRGCWPRSSLGYLPNTLLPCKRV